MFDHALPGLDTYEFIRPQGRRPSQDIVDELTAFARWQDDPSDIHPLPLRFPSPIPLSCEARAYAWLANAWIVRKVAAVWYSY